MSDPHEALRELILVYEELTGEEKMQADEHLAACAACHDRLRRLRRLETAAAAGGSLPFDPADAGAALDPAESVQAAASLRALRQRLDLERSRRFPRLAWPLALAAAAVIALAVWPWPGARRVVVRDLRLLEASTERGGAPVPGPRTVWHTGEAFRLEFTLTRSGIPVVLHLDATGRISRLYPDSSAAVAQPGGVPVRLPPDSSLEEWVFAGQTGAETFFVAAAPGAPGTLDALLNDIPGRGPDPGAGRAALVAAKRRGLEARVGPVQVIEVDHRP